VTSDAPTIRLLGADDMATAFAVVNASWRQALLERSVSVVDDDCADLLVHHDYSAPFGEVALPAARRRVAVRPWDFGPYPASWAEIVARDYDELWVFTSWGRECAVAGGVRPERVRLVPLGVDTDVFHPDGPTHEMTHGVGKTFLFVGAATDRKGIDILLRGFVAAFDAHSDVQLVVKDHTGDAFYTGVSRRDAVLDAARQPGAPRIRYLDAYLAQSELAALYRGATALVLPSRAEGWALPVLEAMACGTPAVVPSFGAFLDYCTNESSVLVDTRRIRVPVGRTFAYNTLGYEAHVESVDFCETAPDVLAAALRGLASESGADSARRGGIAVETASEYRWSRSVGEIMRAATELARST
jgi:glycosyltransferase involved in cell wall biosynthesis